MEVIALPANDKSIPTFPVLVGSCIADNYASLFVWIEEKTRAYRESVCPGQLGKIIIVHVVFVLVVDGAKKRVTEALKLARIEDRKVRTECGSLVKDERGNGSVFGFLADEIDHAGNGATVKSC